MTSAATIEDREAKLLGKEQYLRTTRASAILLGVGTLLLPLIASTVNRESARVDRDPFILTFSLPLSAFLFMWAYSAGARLQHIASIRFHQAKHTKSDASNTPGPGASK